MAQIDFETRFSFFILRCQGSELVLAEKLALKFPARQTIASASRMSAREVPKTT